MKKLLAPFIILVVSLFMPVQLLAQDEQNHIFDDAEIFDVSQTELDKAKAIEDTYGVHVVLHSVNNIMDYNHSSIQNYAEAFYNQNQFPSNSILFVVDVQNREYYMLTKNEAVSIFSESKEAAIEDAFLPYLMENDFHEAGSAFIYEVDGQLFSRRLFAIILCAIIPLIVALIITIIFVAKTRKKPVVVAHANHYLGKESSDITTKNDTFTHTTSRVIVHQNRSSSSGGGGGSRSGGRGGSF